MRRRTILLGGAASAVLSAMGARAQKAGRSYRIGVLSPISGLAAGPYLSAMREQLAKQGFVDGRNLSIDIRFPSIGLRPAVEATRELIALKPDAIFTCTTALTQAAQTATDSVPIVFAWVAEPAHSGIVKNLAKPGANITGASNRYFELTAKRLELIRELLPSVKRVAMAAAVLDATAAEAMKFAHRAAGGLGLELLQTVAGSNWPSAIDAAVKAGAQALSMLFPFFAFGMRFTAEEVIRLAAERRIPAIYIDSETVELGGLMSYGTNLRDDMRRGADLLARVLRGENPSDLSVDQAARFELAINLKTARAMKLTIPQRLLVRANRVIE